VNDREIRADIEDEGQGGASKVQNREKPSYLAESGRGIDIINRCSIRAETDLAESGGLLLRMWFSREGKNRRRRRSKVKQIAT
ncbi:MAG: hypothetical protein ACE5GA_04335, partial [Candidatus Zixiibacteriota bacterium]